jgi:hypothetical protein
MAWIVDAINNVGIGSAMATAIASGAESARFPRYVLVKRDWTLLDSHSVLRQRYAPIPWLMNVARDSRCAGADAGCFPVFNAVAAAIFEAASDPGTGVRRHHSKYQPHHMLKLN